MGQFGFFDADKRLAAISAKGDPLEMIDRVVPFESFRAEIEAVVLTPAEEKKSNAGRKAIDVIVMFRMLVLQSLYNLSDEQVEYQVRDRLSFTRFLRLGIEDRIPDGTTLWLFRETLAKAGLIEKLFERFGQHLEAKGYIARGGQMVDATIVPVPKQRNSQEENAAVKSGGLASSTCSVLSKPLRVVGSCGRSASCGRKPRSACRTSPTISAGLCRWSGWLPHKGESARSAPTGRRAHKTASHSRQIETENNRPAVAPARPTTKSSLFEVP